MTGELFKQGTALRSFHLQDFHYFPRPGMADFL